MEKITRRSLPHWYVPGAAHFVTYRIAGTIPRTVIEDLKCRQALRLRQAVPSGMSVHEHCQRVFKQRTTA